MGEQLESIAKSRNARWSVRPLTREALAQRPLLLIGTLTPVTVERSIDTVPDAFRVWLTLIDLRSGKVIAKQIDRATVDSVNPEPLKYYQDSPSWHKDKTVLGYINSCQVNTKIGVPTRLPGAAARGRGLERGDPRLRRRQGPARQQALQGGRAARRPRRPARAERALHHQLAARSARRGARRVRQARRVRPGAEATAGEAAVPARQDAIQCRRRPAAAVQHVDRIARPEGRQHRAYACRPHQPDRQRARPEA